MLEPKVIKELIEKQLPLHQLVEVNTDDGHHYSATIVAEEFQGKSRVQQQQLVYAALQSHIASGELHAIALRTLTPGEWADHQSK
jgi:acid stress-induced BolA-like protein IbaG/YrbA